MQVQSRRGSAGTAIVGFAIMMVMIVPMVGLAIDGTILFITKARLQAAVDGAALAGSRALTRGTNSTAQISAAQSAAQSYVQLNFPSGYFFSGNVSIPTPSVDLTVAYYRRVNVTASVAVPALFERVLGVTSTTVAASAVASRRDVNVVMVVDRSGSLAASGSCTALKQAAANFVDKFASGRDNVGLITFASSSWIDFPLGTDFQTASPNIAAKINAIQCAGSTSSSQALWQAYAQLAALNQAGALNVIVFFTDGQPTGVAVNMPIKAASPCATKPIRGVFSTFANINQGFGLLSNSVGPQPIANGDLAPAPNSTGCTYYQGWANNGGVNNMTNLSDFNYLPATDIWGNSLDNGWRSVTYSGGQIDVTSGANAAAVTLNAADDAARRIRNAVVDPVSGRSLPGVMIFSLGLGNAGIPVSPDFLRRVSNDPSSPIYDATKPAGLYVAAPTAADINNAFNLIASETLRLAH